jgi:hypothetical protein
VGVSLEKNFLSGVSSANETAGGPEVSVNPGRRKFQRWISTEEKFA